MRHRAKTFHWAAGLLPASMRKDLNRLYRFCRYVDDVVDRSVDRKFAQELIGQIIQDLERESSSIPEVADFLELAKSRNLPLNFAQDLARGVKSDLIPVHLQKQEELLRYCYRVAATVGIMICFLFDVRAPEALAFGIDLGIAMQLTNIARDVFEDHAAMRIYLPSDLVSQATIEQASLGNEEGQEKLFKAVQRVLEIADSYYESAENGICYLPGSARLSIMAASAAYRKIGQIIVRHPERYFRERVRTSFLEKQMCLFTASVHLIMQKKYQRPDYSLSHQNHLHKVLRGLPSFEAVCL
jgi:phytoene synthase